MGSMLDKDEGSKIKDKRKHRRQDFSYAVVEYVLNSDNIHETFIGFTLNVSNSGLCLYTPKSLSEGQKIIIKSNLPTTSKTALVRWIEKYDDVFYKVGLVFI
ncbi:MAG TPA: PilZ domain-containing protein [Thermodesulfovibrionales bacterium]|nr:PilZ domain-containing protein [Thermodesulfovibrionales bacterium]